MQCTTSAECPADHHTIECYTGNFGEGEPPHLDPEPLAVYINGQWIRYAIGDLFAPRPADENGKAYSDKQEDYKRGTV